MTPDQISNLPVAVENALRGERLEPSAQLVDAMVKLLLSDAWSTATPAAPGLYWQRGGTESSARLVRLYREAGGVAWEANHGTRAPSALGGEWIGPLEGSP